ncbi:MAG: aldehyde dehydrogenase family protein, partial [Nitrospirae bacterium]|nr:aldehyde dehydrogenase family protein [Nitrospirota bacterium]
MEKYYNLINGELMPPASGEYFENINPADGSDIVGLFPKSSAKDIELAVQAAKNAFHLWSDMPPPGRGELIYKAGELLLANQERLAKVIVREMGKTMPESMGDIKSSA